MGNVKISQLDVATELAGSETIPVVQSAITKKTTAQDIANLNKTKTSTATSGAEYLDELTVNITPASSSSCQVTGRRVTINYSSNANSVSPGWIEALFKILNVTGTGAKDKVVADRCQINVTGGNVNTILCYEIGMNTIAAGTLVQNLVGFLLPDLSGIANINNVVNIFSGGSLHYKSKHINCGIYEKWLDVQTGEARVIWQEIGPSHAGFVAGRFYLPFGAFGSPTGVPIGANVVYTANIKIPARTTITGMTINYLVGIAASNARIALYYVSNGVPTKRIFESGNKSTATVGGGTITHTQTLVLESGIYCAQIICSAGITLPFINCDNLTLNGTSSLTTMTSNLVATPGGYGTLPDPSLALTLSTSPAQNSSPLFAITV